MKQKVFVTRKIPEAGIKLLKKKFSVTISRKNRVLTKKELLTGLKGKDALLCQLTDRIDAEILKAGSRKLKIVANYAAGYDNIDTKTATKLRIAVTNTPGVLTDAVAEHACALIMAIARRLVEADKFMRAGQYKSWEPMLLLGQDIKGKTLGILGLGRIGTAVAERMARGFGMRILYYDTKRSPEFEQQLGAEYTSVQQLLRESDYVSLHVPLLPKTRHLISAKELASMKKTAYLINTSRGPVVDEKTLVNALKRKQIAGAAIDVFENEPKMAQGMEKLDNIIITPHIASATFSARSAMSEIAAKNITEALNGKKPQNIINPEIYQKQ